MIANIDNLTRRLAKIRLTLADLRQEQKAQKLGLATDETPAETARLIGVFERAAADLRSALNQDGDLMSRHSIHLSKRAGEIVGIEPQGLSARINQIIESWGNIMRVKNYRAAAETLAEDPATSIWLKTSLTTALTRDPVDAYHDAENLLAVLKARLDETTGNFRRD